MSHVRRVPLDAAGALGGAMRRARGAWRRRTVLEGTVVAMALVLGITGLVLVVLGFRGVAPGSIDTARWVVWGTVAVALGWWVVRPTMRQVDDIRLAMYLEEQEPHLGQALLSAVGEARRPPTERLSPALALRLETHAVGELARLEDGARIERPRVRVAAGRLGALGLGAAVMLLMMPADWRSIARAVVLPWQDSAAVPVRALAVRPGDVSVPRGASLDIVATAAGFIPETAELVVQADGIGDVQRLPMGAAAARGVFAARLFDVSSDATYWIEADGTRSVSHRITVTDLPAVRKLSLVLRYPSHTALPTDSLDPGGDVAAVNGTRVTVRATVTMPVRAGTIRFDDGDTVAMPTMADGRPEGTFAVARTGFYTVDLVTTTGEVVAGTVRHFVDALPDRAPGVRITAPGRDLTPTAVEEVVLELAADDDYGVRSLFLHYSVNGGPEQHVALREELAAGTLTSRAVHTLLLEDLSLAAGDLVAYHAEAVDGGGARARSDLYFLEVRPFARDYRQAEAGETGAAGAEASGAESPGELTQRQRDLVVATFNAVRDSAATPTDRRREDESTIALAQGRLRTDVGSLIERMASRGVVALDSTFLIIREALDSATRAMAAAEDALGRGAARDATPAQQRALRHLQRADAAYRDVEVRMGEQPPAGSGGGGGGGGAPPDDLADLFELQTDQLQNQYESIQREATDGAATAREVDEAQERLRALARRAQSENERARRMAEAMQERLAQQAGTAGGAGAGAAGAAGGGAGAAGDGARQRQLAAEAEAEARRLERLARDRQTPALEQAARDARGAADALRRAAAGEQGRGGEAVEALERAADRVDAGREGAAREQAAALARQAGGLRQRQQEIATDVIGLPPIGNPARGAALTELDRRKAALARDVEALDAALAQAELGARRDQTGGADELRAAREVIREGEIPGRITYGGGIARSGSPAYLQRFEDQITAYLDQVTDRIEAAGEAVGTTPERRRARALEEARELNRAAESLRERLTGAEGEAASTGVPAGEGGTEAVGQAPDARGQSQRRGEGQGEGEGRGAGPPGEGERRSQARAGGAGDARQLTGEVRARRQAAEGLRRDLAELGVASPDLDQAIGALRRMERESGRGAPQDLASLQAAVAASLQRVEFELWRRFGVPPGNRPAVGDAGVAPPAYRNMVEEYFRSIARERP